MWQCSFAQVVRARSKDARLNDEETTGRINECAGSRQPAMAMEELRHLDRACRQKAHGLLIASEDEPGKVLVSRPRMPKLIAHEFGTTTRLPELHSVTKHAPTSSLLQ